MLKDVVVCVSFMLDLLRHTVEALGALLRASQYHIRNCTRNSAADVIERMYGDKPEVCKPGLYDFIAIGRSIKPIEKKRHFVGEACCIHRILCRE